MDWQRKSDMGKEPCADVMVSTAARRSILDGDSGAPPVQRNRRRRGVGGQKKFFSKIPVKVSFYPQNFLVTFFSYRNLQHNNYAATTMPARRQIIKKSRLRRRLLIGGVCSARARSTALHES